MVKLKVFTPIKYVPKHANIISSRWVFKLKRDAEGNIIIRKARLVARGFTQQEGIDYFETFSPTLKQDSLRIITALATQKNFKIKQIDVNSAYLNANLTEDIYMKSPEGYESNKNTFWKLNKALYGLKQSGKAWNDQLNNILLKINFKRLKCDPCLYKKENKHGNITCILAVYVDDILLTGNESEINQTTSLIKKYFEIKELGDAKFIIGIKFERYNNGYILHQKRYINDLLIKFKDENIYPTNNIKPINDEKLRNISIDKTKYRSAVGNLLYLSISTRPDIIYAVSKAARKTKDPNLEDWKNILKIMGYLKCTINYGLKFNSNSNIKAYSDADMPGTKTLENLRLGIS